jgi:hypothetical protein
VVGGAAGYLPQRPWEIYLTASTPSPGNIPYGFYFINPHVFVSAIDRNNDK